MLRRNGAAIEFSHPLVRDAFHDRIPAAEWALLHLNAAQLFAADGQPAERVAAKLPVATPPRCPSAVFDAVRHLI